MTLSKNFEKYLKQIVKEAVISAQRTPSATAQQPTPIPPIAGNGRLGLNEEIATLGEEDRFWKIKETPETEDDDEIYCSTFDGMAEAHVEELTEGLNGQLDNLLLFAALFSGINSAFIVFSLPNLNDPFQGMDRLIDVLIGSGHNGTAAHLAQTILDSQSSSPTLNVAVNVLFASSLICSLITAFFAVVGKQWLSYLAEESSDSDERTRRTKMQNKVIGIQRYQLRALLDAYLTTIIQIALLLFIIGLLLFLYTFNNVVTYFVIGFAGTGLLAYIVSAALALLDPACPFQTPVTRTLLPGLFSMSFNASYPLWALGTSLIIVIKNTFSLKSAQPQGKQQQDPKAVQQPEWDDTPGKQRDEDDVFEIQWDRRYALRRNLAANVQFKPEEGLINIEAACWMIQTAENEMTARVAALMLLNLTKREDLGFVATYKNTTRRLRDVISVTDEVLKNHANNSANIKEREWKKLCFYVQVLSHIFAGHTGMDEAQCQVMDWIYEYQRNRNKDKHEYSHTYVPSRMVGVIKLLLLHFDGKHYFRMAPERQKILRERLYQAPFDSNCPSKALSLAAFAMKALPDVALKERDQTVDQKLHDDLWNSYLEGGPDVLRNNFVGAVNTFVDLRHTGGAKGILPSEEQPQKLLDCVATKNQSEACLITANSRAEVIDALAKLYLTLPLEPPNVPASNPSLYHSALPLLQSESNRLVRSKNLAEWKAEDRATLAEACFRLAGRCNDGLLEYGTTEENDAIYRIVRDIWGVCCKDITRRKSESPPFSPVETVNHLRTATALLWAADPALATAPLVSVDGEQRGMLEATGLRWIRDVAYKLGDEMLTKHLFFTSPEARGAISYFLQLLADGDPQGSEEECKFAEKYLLLCQSRGLGGSESVRLLGEAVSRWKNGPGKSD